MELVPVLFKLERKTFLPILTITGICKNVLGAKNILLSKAVELIEITQNELKGKLTETIGNKDDIGICNGMIAVKFSIVFKNDEDISQAIEKIQEELG